MAVSSSNLLYVLCSIVKAEKYHRKMTLISYHKKKTTISCQCYIEESAKIGLKLFKISIVKSFPKKKKESRKLIDIFIFLSLIYFF